MIPACTFRGYLWKSGSDMTGSASVWIFYVFFSHTLFFKFVIQQIFAHSTILFIMDSSKLLKNHTRTSRPNIRPKPTRRVHKHHVLKWRVQGTNSFELEGTWTGVAAGSRTMQDQKQVNKSSAVITVQTTIFNFPKVV